MVARSNGTNYDVEDMDESKSSVMKSSKVYIRLPAGPYLVNLAVTITSKSHA